MAEVTQLLFSTQPATVIHNSMVLQHEAWLRIMMHMDVASFIIFVFCLNSQGQVRKDFSQDSVDVYDGQLKCRP